MLEQINIGEVIVNGMVFDPKYSEAVGAMDTENLLQSVSRLFELLDERNVDYVLVGGIAMLVYVEGRNTQDIDLILASSALDALPEIRIEDRKADFARARFGDLQLDLLFTDNRLFDKVRRECCVPQRFVEREIHCATVEGLLLTKLFALPSLYRQGNFARVELYERDVTMLLREYQPAMDSILAELADHVLPSDLAEIRDIVQGIEQRIARSRDRFGNGD